MTSSEFQRELKSNEKHLRREAFEGGPSLEEVALASSTSSADESGLQYQFSRRKESKGRKKLDQRSKG